MEPSDALHGCCGEHRKGPPRSLGGSHPHRPVLNRGGGAESPPHCRIKGQFCNITFRP